MKLRVALFVLLPASLFAQGSGPVRLVGVVDAVSGAEIRLKSGAGAVSFLTDRKTQFVKGKSPLKPGVEISAACDTNSSGKLVATGIWTSVVSFSGTVVRVNPPEALVSSPRLGNLTVRFYPGTMSFTSPARLKEGEQVYVVGIDVGDAAVDAVRIAVYDTDAPVRP